MHHVFNIITPLVENNNDMPHHFRENINQIYM